MKVLLDECVPQPFCKTLQEHECHAARRVGFGGKRNGELLTLAEEADFDVLITVDKNIPYQQNFTGRRIALIILYVPSNRLVDLMPHVSACLLTLHSIQQGQIVRINNGRDKREEGAP